MAEQASTIKIDAKIQKYRPNSTAGIILRDDKVIVAGNEDHHFASDATFGNFISGKTAIHASLGQVRIGGLWTLNPVLASTIPSTMTTPNATLQFDPPFQNVNVLWSIVNMIKEFLG